MCDVSCFKMFQKYTMSCSFQVCIDRRRCSLGSTRGVEKYYIELYSYMYMCGINSELSPSFWWPREQELPLKKFPERSEERTFDWWWDGSTWPWRDVILLCRKTRSIAEVHPSRRGFEGWPGPAWPAKKDLNTWYLEFDIWGQANEQNQDLEGSFSAVSKPIFASKHWFF